MNSAELVNIQQESPRRRRDEQEDNKDQMESRFDITRENSKEERTEIKNGRKARERQREEINHKRRR